MVLTLSLEVNFFTQISCFEELNQVTLITALPSGELVRADGMFYIAQTPCCSWGIRTKARCSADGSIIINIIWLPKYILHMHMLHFKRMFKDKTITT